jgi:hypothetical protein
MTTFGQKGRRGQFQRRQMHTVYWVWFDEPQFDADGDGPYSGGQVWESALILLTDRPN